MLSKILHRVVAHPRVYDFVQTAVGVRLVYARLLPHLRDTGLSRGRIVDLGGGTGRLGRLVPSESTYVCLDLDPVKLYGFGPAGPNQTRMNADATRVPLADCCADIIVCMALAHHLGPRQLRQVLSESARVLRPGGRFIMLDPVWSPRRPIARLLWRYDRGSHPYTATALAGAISEYLPIRQIEQFAVYHEYVLYVGAKPEED